MTLVAVAAFLRAPSGAGGVSIERLSSDLLGTGAIMALIMVVLDRYHHAVDALRRMALHDGLPTSTTARSSRTASSTRWPRRSVVAAATSRPAIYIDLDDFKGINDRHGHGQGDSVLRAISARLRQGVRAVDTVARVGGDEFAVLLEDVTDRAEASTIVERLAGTLTRPIALPEGAEVVRASAGLAVSGEDGETAEALLANADRAMYHAKGESRAVAVVDGSARPTGPRRRFATTWPSWPAASSPSPSSTSAPGAAARRPASIRAGTG